MIHLRLNLPPSKEPPTDAAIEVATRTLWLSIPDDARACEFIALPMPNGCEGKMVEYEGVPIRVLWMYRLYNPDPDASDGSDGDDFIARVDVAWKEAQ